MSSLFLDNLGAHLALFSALHSLEPAVRAAGEQVASCLRDGGKLMLCGNGGSAADSQHIAAEFTGRFIHDRRPLAAIALTTDTSALTCIANDYSFDEVFARQVEALGRAGDCLLAISTSGNSPNVVRAAEAAKRAGVVVIGLLGRDGGTAGIDVRSADHRAGEQHGADPGSAHLHRPHDLRPDGAGPGSGAFGMNPSRERLAASRVLVVGDAMLDRYWFGAVERISPEAPVPVVRVEREEERLGGAANVALNVRSLGSQVALMSVIGDDTRRRANAGLVGARRRAGPRQHGCEAAHHRQAARHRPRAAVVAGRFRPGAAADLAGGPARRLRARDPRRAMRCCSPTTPKAACRICRE